MGDGGETAAQLAETARAHGFTITENQRARWHREDLLPRPVQRPLGRGHGTVTVYPAGTEAQLVALLRLHEGKRLRIKQARWALWLAGYPVPVTRACHALSEAADEWKRAVTHLCDEGGDGGLSEAAWAFIEGRERTDAPALRRASKRAGRQRNQTFKRLLAAIAAGMFDGFLPEAGEDSSTDRDVFARGMGLYRRSRFAPVHQGAAWLKGDFAGELRALQAAISPDALRMALDAATDDDLMRARDEWRAFLIGLDNVRAIAERMFGAGAYGLAAVPYPTELDGETQAMLLLGWLSFRRLPGFQERIRQLLAALQPFVAFRQAFDMLTPGSADTTEEPPRLRQQSGGMAHGKEDSACDPSLPRPPDP